MSEQNASPMTAFISGPIAPGPDYFILHYQSEIDTAISAGHSFIMGPAPGMDSEALKYLVDQGLDISRITIYLAEFERYTLASRIQWFLDLGGKVKVEGVTTGDRDAAMTRDSNYDILRYMSIEEQQEFFGDMYYPRVSATEKNERRRLGLPLHVNHALVGYTPNNTSNPLPPKSNNISKGWRGRFKKVFRQVTSSPSRSS
ncbi:hypothetical protein B0H34DRAFT_429098 [Crassisporium funariophilum]|nr:hypothetical protein B0H34DRAFT_429098 [Crassisporium funariophilum]